MRDSNGRVDINAETPGVPLRKGYWIAVGLSLLFLITTAYSSAASMFDRIGADRHQQGGGRWGVVRSDRPADHGIRRRAARAAHRVRIAGVGAGGGQCADLEDRAHPVSPHRRRLVLPARGRGHLLQRALVSQDVDGGVLLLPDGQARRSGAVRAGHLPGRRVLQLDGARACGLAQPFEGFWVQEKAGHGHCGRRDRRVANPLLQRPLYVGERCLRRDREAERHHPGRRFAASRRVAPLRVDARHHAEPRPLPRGCRPAARHVHSCGAGRFRPGWPS